MGGENYETDQIMDWIGIRMLIYAGSINFGNELHDGISRND